MGEGVTGEGATQWLKRTKLGNAETLRKMLVLLEQTWNRSLSPADGAPRLITPQVDRLLWQAFCESSRERRPVLECLGELLRDAAVKEVEVVSLPAAEPVGGAREAVEGREEQLLDAFGVRLVSFLDEVEARARAREEHHWEESRRVMKEQRDELRSAWNEQVAGSLRRVELALTNKVSGVEKELDVWVDRLSQGREQELQRLGEIPEEVRTVREEMAVIAGLMERMEGQANTSAELQRGLKSLTHQLAQLEGRLSEVVKEASAVSAQANTQGRSVIREAKHLRSLLPEAKIVGLVCGFVLFALLAMVMGERVLQPRLLLGGMFLGLAGLLIRGVWSRRDP